ncbi:site-specific integrase [Chelatococcus sambhunathii]|uniref:Site-specific integrase n=1 Tax=Chelatococcus sambhunathii TaxID=363953 RepID=A0ABU1DEQ8_9HYPH|nr:site-specific integrase [Chelatococcus sambhunathii]MDR4306577.1 site-specific integrase [Chelatococcus sambhunathii]
MAGKVRHLVERGGRYWARVVVPADVVAVIGSTDLREPLGGERAVALRRLPAAVARFHERIDAARAQARVGAAPTIRADRRLSDRQLAMTHFAEEEEHQQADRLMSDRAAAGDFARARPAYSEVLKRAASGRASNEEMDAAIGWAVDKFSARGNVAVERGSPEWRERCMVLASVQLEVLQRGERRDEGEDVGEPKHPMLRPAPQLVVNGDPLAKRMAGENSHKTLTEIADLVIAEKRPANGTAYEYRVAARMLGEFFGEPRPVYTILRRDILGFKTALMKTPSNYSKRFPGKTLPQAIDANRERAQPFDTLDGATANKWLSRISTLLAWARDNGGFPPDEENPATGVKVEQGRDRKGPPRIPFTPGDLSKIFAAPLFSRDQQLGEEHWALLIGLHTGLRAAEIAQIKLDSVRLERGVLVFAIEEETKNDQSRRVVPVHSTLIALGLEAHIERLRQAGENQLFPEWYRKAVARKETSTSANQTFANYVPRWFNRTLLPSLGIVDGRKKFHSLRHSLKTALARAGVSRDMSDAITGHDDDSAGAGYVHAQAIEAMRDALETVHFDGLDLSSLIRANQGDRAHSIA